MNTLKFKIHVCLNIFLLEIDFKKHKMIIDYAYKLTGSCPLWSKKFISMLMLEMFLISKISSIYICLSVICSYLDY